MTLPALTDTANQFHHEIRVARLPCAGIEHPSDVPVIHRCQSLTLSLKAGDHVARVHARLDEFERDPSPNGLLLLGNKLTISKDPNFDLDTPSVASSL